MMRVQARLVSRSRDGLRAQVTVLMGEGTHQRSVTRHVHFKDGVWIGRNPDEAAIARLDAAERELEKAEREYQEIVPLAEINIEDIKKSFGEIRRKRERTRGVHPVLLGLVLRILGSGKKLHAPAVQTAIKAVVAETAARRAAASDRVYEEGPREVKFDF